MATHLLQPDAAVLDDTVAIEPVLSIAGGRVESIHMDDGPRESGVERIAGTLLPGFVDLQVNGARGRAVDEASVEAFDHVARAVEEHGAAAFLPTLITAPFATLLGQITAVADWIRSEPRHGATPLGQHVEGPFLSNAGAHPASAMIDPTPERVEQLITAGRGTIRLVTLSPSREGAPAAVRQLRAAGITVSLGHGSGQAGIADCVAAGATMATHLFNAMGPGDHRDPGMVVRIMDDEALACSMIVDGIHVHETCVRHAVRVIGVHRAVLVTDAVSAMGMPDGEYTLGGARVVLHDGAVRNGDGVLAGSALTMHGAATSFAAAVPSAGPWTIAQVAAVNPARLIGADGWGRIAVGGRAAFSVLGGDGSWRSLRF